MEINVENKRRRTLKQIGVSIIVIVEAEIRRVVGRKQRIIGVRKNAVA
jgi:hypothetical protein